MINKFLFVLKEYRREWGEGRGCKPNKVSQNCTDLRFGGLPFNSISGYNKRGRVEAHCGIMAKPFVICHEKTNERDRVALLGSLCISNLYVRSFDGGKGLPLLFFFDLLFLAQRGRCILFVCLCVYIRLCRVDSLVGGHVVGIGIGGATLMTLHRQCP